MEPWLNDLIARGLRTGTLTFDEVNAVLPAGLWSDHLEKVLRALDERGIALVDNHDEEPLPPTSLSGDGPDAPPVYYRDPAFEARLRALGVDAADAMCSFAADGTVFDADLIVPGGVALAAWLRLRAATPDWRLTPVIKGQAEGSRFDREPYRLDPGGRIHQWEAAWRKDRSVPFPAFDPEVVRADAAAQIIAASAVPPTPWTFRTPKDTPAAPTGPDEQLGLSVPRVETLFSPAGPFWGHKRGPDAADPAFEFVRIRLYPTAVPWEVFALDSFGGWNWAPWPDEQLAMLRHWHELYGAEVVARRHDWYELFVPRPPRTRHQALRLIAEMTRFGEETIFLYRKWSEDEAVEKIRTAHYWYFWWG